MALVFANRVQETSTTSGTGTLDLNGASAGYRTFVNGIGDTNECFYLITLTGGTEWEIGRGTITDAVTDTLSRDTVIDNSNDNTSLVNFSAGSKVVRAIAHSEVLEYSVFRGARATASAFSVPDVTATNIDWATEDYDSDTLIDLGTNNERITIPAAWANFYVQVGCTISLATAVGCDVDISLEHYNSSNVLQNSWTNGFKAATTNPDAGGQVISAPVSVASGDYFIVVVRHDDGAARNASGDFWIECKGFF